MPLACFSAYFSANFSAYFSAYLSAKAGSFFATATFFKVT